MWILCCFVVFCSPVYLLSCGTYCLSVFCIISSLCCCFFVVCLRFADCCLVVQYALILSVVTFTFKCGFGLL
jgi:hypothetical protein